MANNIIDGQAIQFSKALRGFADLAFVVPYCIATTSYTVVPTYHTCEAS